jgi:hypothetical protein
LTDQKHAIDLTRHHFKRDLGDLSIFGTWINNEDQEDTEPCLVVIPRYRRSGFAPVCVALSAAYKYNDPRYLARVAPIFLRMLGFDDGLSKAHAIASLIHDHLYDLITMPVDPTSRIIVGEASMDLGNGLKTTVELSDHEQIQQA